WILFAFTLVYWLLINAFFGLLYFVDIENLMCGQLNISTLNIHLSNATAYLDGFFFSVQTMATIGYGNFVPQSIYLQVLVAIESWWSLISGGILVAVMIGKVSRPSYEYIAIVSPMNIRRLRHT